MSDEEILHRLNAAGGGLSYPSEQDAPLEPYRFRGPGEPTPEALLRLEGKPPSTPIEEQTLESFLEGLADPGACANETDRAEAAQWLELGETIERELTDVRVYWVGLVDVDIYVLGRTPSGAWVGLHTRAVET